MRVCLAARESRYAWNIVVGARYTPSMASVDHWAGAPPEARYFTELMDELLAKGTRTREQLLERAREMREQAEATDIEGYRTAALRLAKRYEYAAAERFANA
jgi:hypothetical protein